MYEDVCHICASLSKNFKGCVWCYLNCHVQPRQPLSLCEDILRLLISLHACQGQHFVVPFVKEGGTDCLNFQNGEKRAHTA